MTALRTFWSYYIRSALPFVSGLAFGIFRNRLVLPPVAVVLLGAVLVIAGPVAIHVVLTLIAEALRGEVSESGIPLAPTNRIGGTWSTQSASGHNALRRPRS